MAPNHGGEDMRANRSGRHAIISNRQLIEIIKATNDQNRLTSDKIRVLLDAIPSAIKTAAILGRSAGRALKVARAHDEAMSRLKLYGAKPATTRGAKVEVSECKDLRDVFGSNDLKSPEKGGFGGVSVTDRGPKRSLIEQSKAALMHFRAFASRKAGSAYRVARWRRT